MKRLQLAIGNVRILSRLNLSKQDKEKKDKNSISQAQLPVPFLPGIFFFSILYIFFSWNCRFRFAETIKE